MDLHARQGMQNLANAFVLLKETLSIFSLTTELHTFLLLPFLFLFLFFIWIARTRARQRHCACVFLVIVGGGLWSFRWSLYCSLQLRLKVCSIMYMHVNCGEPIGGCSHSRLKCEWAWCISVKRACLLVDLPGAWLLLEPYPKPYPKSLIL